MYDFFARKALQVPSADCASPWRPPALRTLHILLLFGVLVGAVFGTYADPGVFPLLRVFSVDSLLPDSLVAAFWRAGRYFVFLLLASTTFLGSALIPALVFLRGYSLGAAVAAQFAAARYPGLSHAFILSGISAFLTLPLFLLVAEDCAQLSRELFSLRLGRRVIPHSQLGFLRHLLLTAALVLIDAAYIFMLLPRLIRGI